jgi:Ras-related GTP-binding protein C/D
MSPHETLFRLEATQGLEKVLVDHTPLCRFTIWDFPGDSYGGYEINSDNEPNPEADKVFAGSTSLIFVVDAQDEPYDHVLQSFTSTVTRALLVNPHIAVEVFINKVDGELFLSDESKYDCRRDVMTQVTDELTDAGVLLDSVQIRYHLTSIYDHSIYEALSRVVQRLIPQLPTLENLLNVLVSTCSMEKAYLFDVVSKLYISTDSGPVDMQSVELCSDMLDVVLDVSSIYGKSRSNLLLPPSSKTHDRNLHHTFTFSKGLGPSREAVAAEAAQERLLRIRESMNVAEQDLSYPKPTTIIPVDELEDDAIDPDSAYDYESSSVIRLSNGMVSVLIVQRVVMLFYVSQFFCTFSIRSNPNLIGSLFEGSRYYVGFGVHNKIREFPKENID